MAAVAKIGAKINFTGLGKDEELYESFETTTTPTVSTHQYRTLVETDVEEALDLGGVTTPHYVWFKAVDSDIYIDPSYTSATFRNGLTVHAGEVAMFKPAGDVYVINVTTTETPAYEYLVVGV